MRLSRSDLRRAEQSKKSKGEAVRGEEKITGQSRGKVMGAEHRDPAQSSLSVCTAELLLLAHLLHHLDHPPHTHHHPFYHALPPSLPSPVFLFTCGSLQQPGSLLVLRTKMEGIEGGKQEGGGRGGEQRVCFWRVSAAHMLSKES